MMIMPDLSHITVFRSEFTFFIKAHRDTVSLLPSYQTLKQPPKPQNDIWDPKKTRKIISSWTFLFPFAL